MDFESSEPPDADWKKVKNTFSQFVDKLRENLEQDKLAIIDYWIGELFRLRSHIEVQARRKRP